MAIDSQDPQASSLPAIPQTSDDGAVQTYALGDIKAPSATPLDSGTPSASVPDASSGGVASTTDSNGITETATQSQSSPLATQAQQDVTGANPVTPDQANAESGVPPRTECRFIGLDGSPISGLIYRLKAGDTTVDGSTDGDGGATPVTTFPAGADCWVYVKTDAGAYKQVARFTVPSVDSTITLMSPSVLLDTATQPHGGADTDVYKEPPPEAATGEHDQAVHPSYANDSAGVVPPDDGVAASTSTASRADNSDTTTKPSATTPSSTASPSPGSGTSITAASAASASSPTTSAKTTSTKVVHTAPASKTATAGPTSASTQALPKGGTGKTPVTSAVATKRDAVGHPQAQPQETWSDWAGHKINAAWHFIEDWMSVGTNPVAGKPRTSTATSPATAAKSAGVPDPSAVAKKTSEVAEEQTTNSMPSSSTVVNLKQIADGTIKYGTKKSKDSRGQCYMYVKIALWKINAIRFVREKDGKFEGAGGSYAKVAGAFLESQGFRNVMSELPDARWAWPGDVIVYHVAGDTQTADGKGQPGHIDIRTYHYFVSDFKRNYLCVRGKNPDGSAHVYEPVGIYRKAGFSDPLPIARMKAFLKIIRSREAKTFFELGGDSKTYYASQGVYTLSGAIKDLSTYPAGARHQGAYQMTRDVWTTGQKPEVGALPNDFYPASQDRYAVFLMEGRPGRVDVKTHEPELTALGYIRTGEIEKAVALLRSEWACMPGTSQDQGYTMAQLKSDFDKYVKEFSN